MKFFSQDWGSLKKKLMTKKHMRWYFERKKGGLFKGRRSLRVCRGKTGRKTTPTETQSCRKKDSLGRGEMPLGIRKGEVHKRRAGSDELRRTCRKLRIKG